MKGNGFNNEVLTGWKNERQTQELSHVASHPQKDPFPGVPGKQSPWHIQACPGNWNGGNKKSLSLRAPDVLVQEEKKTQVKKKKKKKLTSKQDNVKYGLKVLEEKSWQVESDGC